ncbi:hypothetical protein [Niallia sp. FSL W8-0954]|uniref:hypothetical protein n=1 Tax=Niallia sp. FSL W8-0954 TaxID=2975338 RepID=UPI0030FBA546
MYMKVKRFGVFFLCFTLFLSVLTPKVTLAEENEDIEVSEEEINKLAKELEFVFEEVVKLDDDGNIVNINFEKYDETFGMDENIEQLKEESLDISNEEVTKYSDLISTFSINRTPSWYPSQNKRDKIDACIRKKIKDNYRDTLSIAAITTLIQYVKDGNYKKIAKRLLKMGVKNNALSMAVTLVYYHTQCVAKYQHLK